MKRKAVPDATNVNLNTLMSYLNDIEVYSVFKKSFVVVETILVVIKTLLGMAVSEEMQARAHSAGMTQAARLILLWAMYLGEELLKQNMQDLVETENKD